MRTYLDDSDAWKQFPQHRRWFNKLDLAMRLGYDCGPCGYAPMQSKQYVVRPCYNLSGMGVGSRIEFIEAGDCSKVEPGYFWCEKFEGEHLSVEYETNGAYWFQRSAWQGHKKPSSSHRFAAWTRSNLIRRLPSVFDELLDVRNINVEFLGRKIIEVHLRKTPDPDYDVLIPVWSDDPMEKVQLLESQGFKYIPSPEDADGFLNISRKGFLVNENNDNTKLLIASMLL